MDADLDADWLVKGVREGLVISDDHWMTELVERNERNCKRSSINSL